MKKSRIFTPEQQQWIADNVQGKLAKEITDLFNEHFGTNFTVSQFINYRKNHKVHSDFGCGWNKGRSHFTLEERQYIRDNAKGHTVQELSDMMFEEFGKRFTLKQIQSYKKHNGIVSGLTGRIDKGGKTRDGKPIDEDMLQKMLDRRWQPGQVSPNKEDVGTIVTNIYGYKKIKLADPDVWDYLHWHIWKQHNGEIPKGHIVTFINGDKSDCRIENLALCSREANIRINQMHVDRLPEVIALVEDVVKIDKAIRDRKKANNNG